MLLDEVLALLGRGGVLPVQLFMEGMVEFFLRWICYLAGSIGALCNYGSLESNFSENLLVIRTIGLVSTIA